MPIDANLFKVSQAAQQTFHQWLLQMLSTGKANDWQVMYMGNAVAPTHVSMCVYDSVDENSTLVGEYLYTPELAPFRDYDEAYVFATVLNRSAF